MLETLITVLTIILVVFFLGLCVFVHELGHLLVALWRGLHVEKFSVGFGRRLWGFKRKGVEYVVSLLPFGGYVALPQLDPTEEPTDKYGSPLPVARPVDRILTAFSGPLANIIFGFLLAMLVWWLGVYRPVPKDEYLVHQVAAESPEFAAGLRGGDVIIGLNGKSVPPNADKLMEAIALTPGRVSLNVRRDDEELVVDYQPAPNPEFEGLGFPFFQVRTPVVIEAVMDGYPAAAAGLAAGDLLVAVNGERVINRVDFVTRIWASEGAPVSLTYARDGEEVTIASITPRAEDIEGETVHVIGVRVGEPEQLVHMNPWAQFTNVVGTTRKTVSLLFRRDSLVKPRHMSGPVGIVQMNYMMIRYKGLRQGLFFVVFVSFSLALLNLLPIPVLDGGHILFALVEMGIRRRVPCRLAYAMQMAFAVLLIGFMLYVTFFDFRRVGRNLFPRKEAVTEETGIQPDVNDNVEEPENARD
jgi:regulator of sigma E protease